MNSKLGLTALALLCWLDSASYSVFAADEGITGKAVNAEDSFCEHLTAYFVASQPLPQNLELPHNPSFPEISFPDWEVLNPRDHLDVLKRMYMRVGRGFGNELTDDQWENGHLPKLLASIDRWHGQFETATFDVDNDGVSEQFYRLSLEVHDAYSDRRSIARLPLGTMAWISDVGPSTDLLLVDQWRALGSLPNEIFFLAGKSFHVLWDYGDQERTIDISSLSQKKIAEKTENSIDWRQECIVKERMR